MNDSTQLHDAIEELAETLEALQLGAEASRTAVGIVVDLPDGTAVRLVPVPTRSTSPSVVRSLVESTKFGEDLVVVVADRVSAALGEWLRDMGAGWLDRRGHLRLVRGGLVIDTDVPPLLPPANGLLPRDPCATPVGREVALELLVAPGEAVTARALARALGRAPSSVAASLRALRDQGLVDDHRRPVNPGLFWALAAAWQPRRHALLDCPDPSDADADWSYELHVADLDVAGWALCDTRAASAWGVPLIASGAYPPDLYVPDNRVLMRAMRHYGEATAATSRACTLAVAPAPSVCARRYSGHGPWPLVHPVVVALDLAVDPGRGSEALDAWDPDGIERVW